jgi:O-antigen/teichoic acid export membrane protein
LFAVLTALSSVFSALSLAVAARNLPVSSFGSFSFALSFLAFAAMFFELGIFAAASRIAAQSEGRDRQEIVAAALLLFAPIALVFVLAVFAASFVVDDLFNVQAGLALRVTAPLAFAYLFASVALQIAQGVDRLHLYSITSALGQFLFFVSLVALVASTRELSVSAALAARGFAALVAMVVLAAWLKPVLGRTRVRVQQILRQVRAYGFQVFVGRTLGIGTYNMDVLMVGAWTNANTVGLYTLAAAMAAALGLPAAGLSAALFPRLVDRLRLDRRWLLLAGANGLAGLLLLWLFHSPLTKLFFSSRYDDIGIYVLPLAAAQAVRGVTGIYNSFLSAHGYGRELRNAAFVLTGTNLALNFALIPPYGALGAAWASFFALLANFGAHVVSYHRMTRETATPQGAAL